MVANSFGNRNFVQPMGRLSMHSKCLDFFPFKFWVGVGEDFFHFSFVPNGFQSGSQYVPKVPNVFPIAPPLNPICFAQSPPLLTYIDGPKGEVFHLSIESSMLGKPPQFQLLILLWANQIGSLQKRSWTCEAPPTKLI
jgi:hypothetical protein